MFDPESGYPRVVPYVRYLDPPAAVTWLRDVLGAVEAVRLTIPDGRIGHMELRLGSAAGISVGLAPTGDAGPATPRDRPAVRAMTLVFVDDVDASARRAVELGGTLIDEPTDMPWGLRQAIVADPEGHVWELTHHTADVPASSWGADMVGPWFSSSARPD